jgi:hypothetical protein
MSKSLSVTIQVTIQVMGGATFPYTISDASITLIQFLTDISINGPAQHIKSCPMNIKLVKSGKILFKNKNEFNALNKHHHRPQIHLRQ